MNINYQTLILQNKNKILDEIKIAKNSDLEKLVYRMQLTYDEVIIIIGIKYFPTKKNGLFFQSRYL